MLKIALPSRDGIIDEHFGHCEYYTLLTVDETRNIVKEERLTPPPGCGCKSNIVPILVDLGVSVLVGGNMGEGAVMTLRRHGIDVVRGASGPVQDAARNWLDGRLADRQELCTSHGHHGCGNH